MQDRKAAREKDLQRLTAYVKGLGKLRPPHDPKFFPCSFDDCVFCVVRKLHIECMDQLSSHLAETLANMSVQTESCEQKKSPSKAVSFSADT